jgi:hypothetical protein
MVPRPILVPFGQSLMCRPLSWRWHTYSLLLDGVRRSKQQLRPKGRHRGSAAVPSRYQHDRRQQTWHASAPTCCAAWRSRHGGVNQDGRSSSLTEPKSVGQSKHASSSNPSSGTVVYEGSLVFQLKLYANFGQPFQLDGTVLESSGVWVV